MKKSILILILAVAAVACKKEHTCECTFMIAGTPVETTLHTMKGKKADAQTDCQAMSRPEDPSTSYKTVCDLQ